MLQPVQSIAAEVIGEDKEGITMKREIGGWVGEESHFRQRQQVSID